MSSQKTCLLRRLILSDSPLKTFSLGENQFSGKTYFYTIASSSRPWTRLSRGWSSCTTTSWARPATWGCLSPSRPSRGSRGKMTKLERQLEWVITQLECPCRASRRRTWWTQLESYRGWSKRTRTNEKSIDDQIGCGGKERCWRSYCYAKHIFSGHFPQHDYHDLGPTRTHIVHLYLSLPWILLPSLPLAITTHLHTNTYYTPYMYTKVSLCTFCCTLP